MDEYVLPGLYHNLQPEGFGPPWLYYIASQASGEKHECIRADRAAPQVFMYTVIMEEPEVGVSKQRRIRFARAAAQVFLSVTWMEMPRRGCIISICIRIPGLHNTWK